MVVEGRGFGAHCEFCAVRLVLGGWRELQACLSVMWSCRDDGCSAVEGERVGAVFGQTSFCGLPWTMVVEGRGFGAHCGRCVVCLVVRACKGLPACLAVMWSCRGCSAGKGGRVGARIGQVSVCGLPWTMVVKGRGFGAHCGCCAVWLVVGVWGELRACSAVV